MVMFNSYVSHYQKVFLDAEENELAASAATPDMTCLETVQCSTCSSQAVTVARWPTAVYSVSWWRESPRMGAETCETCCGCTDDDGLMMFHVEKTHMVSRPPWGGCDDEEKGSLMKDSKTAAMCLRGMWFVNNIARHDSTTTTIKVAIYSIIIHNPIYSSVLPICIDLLHTAKFLYSLAG